MSEPENPAIKDGSIFNMAIATLMRLSTILDEYRRAGADLYISDAVKQNLKLRLLKDFLIQSAPLLKDDFKAFEEVLSLKPKIAILFNGKIQSGKKITHDPELDLRMDKYLVDIQIKLQEGGYFMPLKNDPRLAFARK